MPVGLAVALVLAGDGCGRVGESGGAAAFVHEESGVMGRSPGV